MALRFFSAPPLRNKIGAQQQISVASSHARERAFSEGKAHWQLMYYEDIAHAQTDELGKIPQ